MVLPNKMCDEHRSDISKKSVLVWGGLGFLGQPLVSKLLEGGMEVSVLCRSRKLYPAPVWASRVRWFELDGADPGGNSVLFEAVSSASIIYDFAGSSGAAASNRQPSLSLDENCRTQLAFLAACEKAGHCPHVVFPSSWLVYASGQPGPGGEAGPKDPVDETCSLGPLSMYAAHRLCIEHYLKIYAARGWITYTICRISNPYGFDPAPTARGYKVLNTFIQRALAGKPIEIFGDGRQLRDFIYISDVARALFHCGLVPEARNEVMNISSGNSHALVEAVETLIDLIGPSPVMFRPWPDEYRSVEPGDYRADISKARRLLGFHPEYDLKSGLRETIRDYSCDAKPRAVGISV